MGVQNSIKIIFGYKIFKKDIYKEIVNTTIVNSCEHKERIGNKYCPICGIETKEQKEVSKDYEILIPLLFNNEGDWNDDLIDIVLYERYSNCDEDDFIILGTSLLFEVDDSTIEILPPTQQEVDKYIEEICGVFDFPKEHFGMFYMNNFY
jgi:hypothetical protein